MRISTIYIENYGALRDKRIELSDGLNLIQGENESGKSTVCAFIKFIFYGHTDSKERELRTSLTSNLSAGFILFEHSDGKAYRIDRRESDGKSKVTVLCESNGEVLKKLSVTPGEYFLGIPEKLYTRSLFISQKSAPELDKQSSEAVSNLLTGGSEALNVKRAERQLDEMRKEYRHLRGRGGLIPEAEDELDRVRSRFREAVEKKLRMEETSTEIQRVSDQKVKLEAMLLKSNDSENAFNITQEYVSKLNELSRELEFSQKTVNSLEILKKSEPVEPKGFDVFESNPDESKLKQTFLNHQSAKQKFTVISAVTLLLSLLCFILSGISAIFIALGSGLLALGAFAVFTAFHLSKSFSELWGELECKSISEIESFYTRCRSYTEDLETFNEHSRLLENAHSELMQKKSELTQALALSGAKDVNEAVLKLQASKAKLELNYQKIQALNLHLRELEVNYARLEGEHHDDANELSALDDALCERLSQYEKAFCAVKLALDALGEAQKSVRQTFIPQISAVGGRYFDRLTDGKYSSLSLNSEFGVSLRQDADTLPLSEEYFSGGSHALAWFCLRLALAGRLSDGRLPMILDEPFVYFDEKRLASSLELLSEIAENGVQILLFSASNREKTVLGDIKTVTL